MASEKKPVVRDQNFNTPEVRQHARIAMGFAVPQDSKEKIKNPGSGKGKK